MKKTVSILVIAMLLLMGGMGVVNATTSFKASLAASSTRVSQGEEVVLTLSLKDFTANETGINAFLGTVDYDKTIFETAVQSSFTTSSGWAGLTYNDSNGSFAVDNSSFIAENHELLKLTLKVKSNATLGNTVVTFKSLQGSDSNVDISPADAKVTLTIKAASDTNTNNNANTNNNTNTNTNTNSNTNTMPNTGVVDYILPTIVIIAVVAIFAYVKYNRMDK